MGEHLKARRLALHCFQSDVAKKLGAEKTSLQNWERGIYEPIPRFYPAIIRFLGYVPFTHDGTLGGKTRWLRLCAGWTQEELANSVGCEECTIWRWETNQGFDQRLWSRGIAAIAQRLVTLGLSDLTGSVVQELNRQITPSRNIAAASDERNAPPVSRLSKKSLHERRLV